MYINGTYILELTTNIKRTICIYLYFPLTTANNSYDLLNSYLFIYIIVTVALIVAHQLSDFMLIFL